MCSTDVFWDSWVPSLTCDPGKSWPNQLAELPCLSDQDVEPQSHILHQRTSQAPLLFFFSFIYFYFSFYYCFNRRIVTIQCYISFRSAQIPLKWQQLRPCCKEIVSQNFGPWSTILMVSSCCNV